MQNKQNKQEVILSLLSSTQTRYLCGETKEVASLGLFKDETHYSILTKQKK